MRTGRDRRGRRREKSATVTFLRTVVTLGQLQSVCVCVSQVRFRKGTADKMGMNCTYVCQG